MKIETELATLDHEDMTAAGRHAADAVDGRFAGWIAASVLLLVIALAVTLSHAAAGLDQPRDTARAPAAYVVPADARDLLDDAQREGTRNAIDPPLRQASHTPGH